MDGQKDDTHKASDGQAEGVAYDPFVLFGPGSAAKRRRLEREGLIKRLNVYCKRCGCRSVFCKCTVEGGIGRIFMTYDQATWCYVYNCMQGYPIVKLYANNREFIEGIKSGAVTCHGKQITYRG